MAQAIFSERSRKLGNSTRNRTATIELWARETIPVQNIRSTTGVARCLSNEWPVKNRAKQERAVIGCKMALSGKLLMLSPDFQFRPGRKQCASPSHCRPTSRSTNSSLLRSDVAADMYAQDLYE
ncbi:DUF982 domain-containing protein [Rhizobium sp. Root482]|uniref:DUF982 domain-containing protein n=1 Tax=Rhizobium sp. Root482 TaxID=1736543 RepID=UPI0006F74DE9|nr:hypothetical protein ASD31_23270 [Rhizobium sp. Root482]